MVFFTVIMTFYVAGIYPLYLFSDYQLKKIFLHRLSTNAQGISNLSFTYADFAELEWENDFECKINNCMFDVVHVEKKENVIVVAGFFDTDEDALLNAMGAINGFNTEKNKRTISFLKLLSFDFEKPMQAIVSNNSNEFVFSNRVVQLFSVMLDNKLVRPPIQ